MNKASLIGWLFVYLNYLYVNKYKVKQLDMSKKVIISESMFKKIISEEVLNEAGISKNDIVDAVKDALKNDRSVKNDMEKRIREIVASAVNTLFKTLWQRRNFYEDDIKRG